MLAQNAQRSLETAAAPTLARIRTDQTKVDSRLRPLLEHIENHLFDPGLDVNQLKRRCGVRDNSIPIQFHAKLGLPPHAYIEDCRLTTACLLLRDTDLKIWQIASLLGYSSIQVFSRAFSRWAKTRPTAYRRSARRDATDAPNEIAAARVSRDEIRVAPGLAGAPSAIQAAPASRETELQRALDGQLDAHQAARLIRRLLNLYPATGLLLDRPAIAAEAPRRNGTASVPTFRARMATPQRTNGHHANGNGFSTAITGERAITAKPLTPPGADYRGLLSLEDIEAARASALWDQIKHLPQDEMRTAIRNSGPWETDSMFEAVRKGAIEQGRDDRSRGVKVSQLLLDTCIDSSSESKMQAKAWLANAYRLVPNLPRAKSMLNELRASADNDATIAHKVRGDIHLVASNLHMYERNYEPAVSEADKAIEQFSMGECTTRKTQGLLSRATFLAYLERYEESSADAERALEVLGSSTSDRYLRFTALSILARNQGLLGSTADAQLTISRIKSQFAKQDGEYLTKTLWLEAEVARQAGEITKSSGLLGELVSEFLERRRPSDAAFATLELAQDYLSLGRASEVVGLLSDVVPSLQKLQMPMDALAALKMLSQAVQESRVTDAIMESARSAITRSRLG